jgi:hypothetical protein
MAKNKISEFSTTAANNTDIAGINISEGCAPSGINNAIRELMAQLKDQQTGADSDNFVVGGNLSVTGTTTLTGAATAPTPTFADSTTKIATTAFVQAALAAAYPVGSIYINATSATNPATLLGFGTWVAFGAGRVMVGLDAGNALFDTAEETGGAADATLPSHTHTATSVVTDPSHSHTFPVGGSDAPYSASDAASATGETGTTNTAVTGITVATTNESAGTSGTNANYQPYITVRMWKRTA